MRCAGRIVLVTGAQRGIGRATALRFARAGADVAINFLDDEPAAKAGIVNLTRVLANEWHEHGIRVNAVAPTFVETPLTLPMFEDEAFRADVLRRLPDGRNGRPAEVVGAIVFLASDQASLVTGHSLAVDGGWTAW